MNLKSFILIALANSFLIYSQTKDFDINEFYPIDNSHSYINYSIKYMGYAKVKGSFEKFDGTFRYDEANISKFSTSIVIDVNSIDTDNDRRDKDLKSSNWFDSKEFPFIIFSSTKVKSTDSGFLVIGNLTIKGITHKVTFTMNEASGVLFDFRRDTQVILTGKTSLKRSDFNIEGKRWSAIKEGIAGVEDLVEVEISILGKQTNLSNLMNWVKDETRATGAVYKKIKNGSIDSGLRAYEENYFSKNRAKNPNILNTIGQILFKQDNKKEATQVFEKNIELFPSSSFIYCSLGELLTKQGELDKAREYYKNALQLDSNNQNAIEVLKHL